MKLFNPLALDSTASEEERGRSREGSEGERRNWRGKQKERGGNRENVRKIKRGKNGRTSKREE